MIRSNRQQPEGALKRLRRCFSVSDAVKLLDLQQPGEPPRPTVEVLLEWDPARPPFCRNDNINSSSGSCCSNAAGGGGTSPESRGGIKSASLRQKRISFCVTFGGDNGESVARMRQYQSPVDKHAHTDTHTQ